MPLKSLQQAFKNEHQVQELHWTQYPIDVKQDMINMMQPKAQ